MEDGGHGVESEDDEEFESEMSDVSADATPLYCLPLYSLLPTSEQQKVFQAPPDGARFVFLCMRFL